MKFKVYKLVVGKNIEYVIVYVLYFYSSVRRIMSLCNFLFVCDS